MAIKAGIWIDHRQAIVVLVTDAGKTIKRIASGFKSADHSSSQHKYTPNDFVAEDRLEHKFMNLLKIFYDEVIALFVMRKQFWSLVQVKPRDNSLNASRARSFVAELSNWKRLTK